MEFSAITFDPSYVNRIDWSMCLDGKLKTYKHDKVATKLYCLSLKQCIRKLCSLYIVVYI
jgi:hypothetical protein